MNQAAAQKPVESGDAFVVTQHRVTETELRVGVKNQHLLLFMHKAHS